eukprot:CAMPEP_0174373638 /NCGR_PEP_ID=MMETSP0811_2-20130205/107954_1 /TAXON_ID=73025 ORGANISM="Eutreptiella gymnastica-like, Strain CCMP1594" /NCGR_SAMPLE_ID=MMETSP0811_2 /ASSEMBLY_ACC=CAM_ASM_000667 /LENGTH=73 /DNA_ID=CAMNT_0015522223 /DNA_START=65 /DNA_END=284 /DNA_ORIENTATION=+
MRAVYAIAHHWLKHNAKWNDKHYTDTVIPPELQPEGYKPTWSTDIHLLQVVEQVRETPSGYAPLVCVQLGGST